MRLQRDLERLADGIAALRRVLELIRNGKGNEMGKLAGIADRIKDKAAAHARKADEWAARLDAIDQREPEAFAVGEAAIAEREADLTSMENDLRALSNLPLQDSAPSSSGSEVPAAPKPFPA